ncbi:hypothetical protein OH76DRAFT_794492 [Lentinus brumalis]|uniref:Uncharacterized protein n=1 Tax=Lentinus brumalis TaxID=2498619 RepID=A0A371D3M6_9APHY|nr:hypothetical protein OH76DRAFT_794492 [Polyporus brumalis]
MSENEISKLSADPLHDCSRDHVLRWPGLRKRFELHVRDACLPVVVTLSFTRCPLNPERTLVLDASYHRV